MVWPSSCRAVSCCCGISMWLMLACASESITRTFLLWKAESVSARARTSVDLPTPPLAFMTVMVLRILKRTQLSPNCCPSPSESIITGRCGCIQSQNLAVANGAVPSVVASRPRAPWPHAARGSGGQQLEESSPEGIRRLVHDPVASALDEACRKLRMVLTQD